MRVASIAWCADIPGLQVYLFRRLSNDLVKSEIDIIDTYVYRIGMEEKKFSQATAAGLFKSLIGLALVLTTNYIAKKVDPDSGIM